MFVIVDVKMIIYSDVNALQSICKIPKYITLRPNIPCWSLHIIKVLQGIHVCIQPPLPKQSPGRGRLCQCWRFLDHALVVYRNLWSCPCEGETLQMMENINAQKVVIPIVIQQH